MLNLLKINNIALIDALEIEFGTGLNLLTGETGSGKSIIVDSLGALAGERVTSDLIKEGADTAKIEGLFLLERSTATVELLDEAGIEIDDEGPIELIVRREISLAGRNRIFVNNQLVTAAFLRRLGPVLVDIHGQGEQTSTPRRISNCSTNTPATPPRARRSPPPTRNGPVPCASWSNCSGANLKSSNCSTS